VSVRGFRAPQQTRSQATLERIAVATESLLLERGPDGITIHDVVERAGSSVGSFYARFEDREAAVRYLQDRFWRDAEARWREHLAPSRWRGRSAVQVVTGFVRSLTRAMTADRRRYRMFLLQALEEPDDELRWRTAVLDAVVADGVAALLDERRDELDPLPAGLAHEGVLRVLSAIRDALVFGDPSPEADRRLALSLVGMLGSLLGLGELPRSWSELLALEVGPPSGSRSGREISPHQAV